MTWQWLDASIGDGNTALSESKKVKFHEADSIIPTIRSHGKSQNFGWLSILKSLSIQSVWSCLIQAEAFQNFQTTKRVPEKCHQKSTIHLCHLGFYDLNWNIEITVWVGGQQRPGTSFLQIHCFLFNSKQTNKQITRKHNFPSNLLIFSTPNNHKISQITSTHTIFIFTSQSHVFQDPNTSAHDPRCTP